MVMISTTINDFESVLSQYPFEGYIRIGGLWKVSLDYMFEVTLDESPVEFRNVGTIDLKFISGEAILVDAKYLIIAATGFIDGMGEGDDSDILDAAETAIATALSDFTLLKPDTKDSRMSIVEETVIVQRDGGNQPPEEGPVT